MRTLIRSALAGALLSLTFATVTLAKGESMGATIGPIDDTSAGTPTQVSVQMTMDGKPTSGALPVYIDFLDPHTNQAVEFPLTFDSATGTFIAKVTLPHEGNWVVNAFLRSSSGPVETLGRVDGTRLVTVRPAPAAPTASPVEPAVVGAVLASLGWLAAIALYALRRRMLGSAVPGSAVEGQPA